MSNAVEHLLHIPTLFIVGAFLCITWWPLISTGSWGLIGALIMWAFIADLITGLFYFLYKKTKEKINSFPLWCGFAVTGLALVSLPFVYEPTWIGLTSFCYTKHFFISALIIGCVQGIALLPGISRLASTYVAGCWLGFTPLIALTLSLTIQFPLIIAALIETFYEIHSKNIRLSVISLSSMRVWWVVVASMVSFMLLWGVAFLAYANLMYLFGWYMVVLFLYVYFFY
jgi:undecaprenyl-diphosphatase